MAVGKLESAPTDAQRVTAICTRHHELLARWKWTSGKNSGMQMCHAESDPQTGSFESTLGTIITQIIVL